MNRFLKWIIFLLLFAAIGIFLFAYSDIFKKPLSPKDTVEFKLNDLDLEVFYNRSSKEIALFLVDW